MAGLIKKTAQKLVDRPKHLQKLALTLPLLALFVEEVRAAQGKSAVFEDLQALTEFVDAQNLDDAQYAEIEESLDGVELAANDVTEKEVAAVAEEETEKAAILEEEGGATAKRKAALLEPGSETGAGRGFAAEAESGAAGVAGEHAAAGATETFELAGLVVPVAPLPLLGTLAAGIGLANANTGGATNTETATGTTLSRTLKQLKTDGIVFVQPASGSNVINVELGTGAALTSTTGVTLFGDTDRDGTVTAAENAALQVTLIIANADQLAEVAAITGRLTDYGIDSVRIDLSNQDLLNALASDANLAANLAAIRASGLTVTTIDMLNDAASLTLTQAQVLSAAGLTIASADVVTLTVADSAGLSDAAAVASSLHTLGVDTIDVGSNAASLTLTQAQALSAAGLTIASADVVTLTVADSAGLSDAAAVASSLHTLGVDTIDVGSNAASLSLTQAQALSAAGLTFASADVITLNVANSSELSSVVNTATDLHTLGISTIDMGGSANVAASLSDAQAQTLVADGLHFASSDTITLNADTSHGTHLSTSLKDLQKLGVDAVALSGGADQHLMVDLGAGAFSSAGLPTFASALDVTLNIDSTQVSQIASSSVAAALHTGGVDHLNINLLDASGSTAGFGDELATLLYTSGLDSLKPAGLDATIDLGGSANVSASLTDLQAQTMIADGLHFAANDTITFNADTSSGTHLSTSLKDLQKLGVDTVTLTGGHNIDLGAVDFTAGVLPHFGTGGDVTLNLSSTELNGLSASDINKLAQAGIDHLNLGSDITLTQSQLAAIDAAGLDIASHTNVTLQVAADAAFPATADITAMQALGVDQIDMANDHASISQAQAQALVDANVKFVDSDSVTMDIVLDANGFSLDTVKATNLHNAGVDHFNVDAPALINETFAHLMLDHQLDFVSANDITLSVAGTHMGTSLSDLQKLGVDHVAMSISNSADFNFALNHTTTLQGEGVDLIDITTDAASINLAAANALANANIAFSAEDDITLDISADPTVGSAEFVAAMTHAQDLEKMGVDHIDFLSNAGWLNDVGATQLINAGIDFAAEDDISLRLTNSTYVAQHAVEISKLGVDHVQINTGTTDFGEIETVAKTLHDAGLATFDMDIFGSTLKSLTDLQTLDSIQNNGIDFNVHIAIGSDVDGFNKINGLAFSSLHPDANTTFGQLIGALQEAGIHDYIVDGFNDGNSFLALPDSLAAALQEAGMLSALPDANFKLDTTHNATFNTSHQALNTSLSAMSELGIDEVVSADTVNKFFVELGNNTDVAAIIAGFENGSVAPTQDGLFGAKDAGLVIDQATFDHFSQFTPTAMSDLLSKLSSLGFTEIDVLKGASDSESYHINVTAQTPVLDTPVQIVGTDAQALLDVFSTDIQDKKIS
ncbi:hypothetical protein LMORI2_12010 [Limnohabitans sp. MORI2]|uniref:beta strand repeat-containing protein n=1 Tax=Limnohabitans sp. MORI2 TaxID=1751150 RepID=UPI0023778744|nr:hypothetical protein [Limnohabitans sp. MORI2]BDU58219.1 hypothetical protein LMORI2_12010 [Limnohabitans sp. MORI2]